MSISRRSVVGAFARAGGSRSRALFRVTTINGLEDVVRPELRAAARRLETGEIEELAQLTEQVLTRRAPVRDLLGRLGARLGDEHFAHIGRLLEEEAERAGVPFLFKADLTGFHHTVLDEEYARSVRRRRAVARTRKKPFRQPDAMQWALETGAEAARRELRRLFGDDYRAVLRGVSANRVVTTLSTTEIAHFDAMMLRGVDDYGTLAGLNRGFGHLYEVDHLFEQRFWNVPDVAVPYDVLGNSFAFVVPKNSRIALLLQKDLPVPLDPGKRIRYVHTEKTRRLRQLIPNGKEHHFSVQQMWDAHVAVFSELGFALDSAGRGRLEDMFRIYVDGLRAGGRTVEMPVFRSTFPADHFTPAGGWPTP